MKRFGEFCTIILMSWGLTFVASFVVFKLWGWLVAPVFELPELSYLHCVGIMVFRRIFTAVKTSKEEGEGEVDFKKLWKMYFKVIVGFSLTLLSGWLLHLLY